MRDELDALFRELQSKAAVNYHLGGVVRGLMDVQPPLDQKDERFRRRMTRGFIREHKGNLDAAMDHLNRFAMVIGNLEMLYQQILDHPELDLESKVVLENSARDHVARLKRLHGRQKTTLTDITQLFLRLSRKCLKGTRKRK